VVDNAEIHIGFGPRDDGTKIRLFRLTHGHVRSYAFHDQHRKVIPLTVRRRFSSFFFIIPAFYGARLTWIKLA
jgi:hypothetical protein